MIAFDNQKQSKHHMDGSCDLCQKFKHKIWVGKRPVNGKMHQGMRPRFIKCVKTIHSLRSDSISIGNVFTTKSFNRSSLLINYKRLN